MFVSGSGKTAAFLLPILHTLLTDYVNRWAATFTFNDSRFSTGNFPGLKSETNPQIFFLRPREGCLQPECVIVTPTRELAIQVCCFGAISFCFNLSPSDLWRGAQILIWKSASCSHCLRRWMFICKKYLADKYLDFKYFGEKYLGNVRPEKNLGDKYLYFKYEIFVCSGVATGSQLPQISEGCNLLVATPGRWKLDNYSWKVNFRKSLLEGKS